jgi:uncharacterized RDD family membrane protein YckC
MESQAMSSDPDRASVAARLAGATGLERVVAGAVEEAIVRTVESDAVVQAIERIVEDGRLQKAIQDSIDPVMIEDAVRRALENEVSDRVWVEILASDKAQMLVERIAEAPEVRAAITQQGFGLISDIGRQVSRITEALDDVVERVAHTIFRRGDHDAETNQAGLVTRLAAFGIDVALLFGFLSLGSAVFSAVIPTVFGGGGDGLPVFAIVALVVAGLLFAGGVFVTFWTLIGQTPGMRFLGIRLQRNGSNEIGFRTSLRRAIAIPIALIPFGLGFLGILISPRRRGLHDVIAGTEVIYDEASAPWSMQPREWVHPREEREAAQSPGPRRP